MKKFLLVILLLMVLGIGAIVAVPFVVDINDYKEPILRAAGENLGRSVDVQHIDWKIFPRLEVHLKGLSLAERDAPQTQKGFQAGLLRLALQWGPLLKGQVQVKRLEISDAVVQMPVGVAGRAAEPLRADKIYLNVSDLTLANVVDVMQEMRNDPEAWRDLEGRVRFRLDGLDASSLQPFAGLSDLDGKLDAQLSLRQEREKLMMDLSLQADSVRFRVPGRFKKDAGMALRLNVNGSLDGRRVMVHKGVAMVGSAKVTLREASYGLDDHDLKGDLHAALILEDLLHWMDQTGGARASGKAEVDATVTGNADRLRDLKLEGVMDLQDLELRWPGILRSPVQGHGSVRLDADMIRVQRLTLKAGRSDLTLEGIVEGKAGDSGHVNISSDYLDLEELFNVFEMPVPREGQSRIAAGAIAAAAIAADKGVPMKTVAADASAEEAMGAAVAAAATSQGLAKWSFQGQCHFGELVYKKNRMRDLSGNISLQEGVFTLSKFRGKAYRGEFSTAIQVDIQDPAFGFRWGMRLTGIELADVLAANSKLTDGMAGRIGTRVELAGRLAGGQEAVLASLDGVGEMQARELTLNTFNVMKNLSGLTGFLGIPGLAGDKTYLQTLQTSLQISGGRVTTPDVQGTGEHFDFAGKGSFGFDRSLDYYLKVRLSDEVTSRLGSGPLVQGLLGEGGQVIIPFRMTGRIDGPPKFEPMWEEILARKAKQTVQDYLERKIRGGSSNPIPGRRRDGGGSIGNLIFDILSE